MEPPRLDQGPPRRLDHRDAPPGELISGALDDARDLATAEIDKLKAEAGAKAKSIGDEVKTTSVGLLVLTIGAILLGVALSLGIAAAGLPAWAGFAIVGAAFGLGGVVLLKRRKAIAEAG